MGQTLAKAMKEGGTAGYDAFVSRTLSFANGKSPLPAANMKELLKWGWALSAEAADRNNKRGTFTTFIGFEWTSTRKGNNLHRNVIFRDGGDKTNQVIPFTLFDSFDPVDLWHYCEEYEKKTGGRVLTIAHNPNLSCGLMFADQTEMGKSMDVEYAQLRARFDSLAEATQCKGDSETTPQISPAYVFADFERWNKCNIFGMQATTAEMLHTTRAFGLQTWLAARSKTWRRSVQIWFGKRH